MLSDFITIQDVFENPDEIVRFAKSQKYDSKETHYHNVNGKSQFEGKRSQSIGDIDKQFSEKMNHQIYSKIFLERFPQGFGRIQYKYHFKISSYFHIVSEENEYSDNWKHYDDTSLMAGVVYLNKDTQEDCGTVIYKQNGEVDQIVKNEYNKLVLYSSTHMQSAQRGFGTNVDDSRLTLNIFIKQMNIECFTEE